MVVVIRPFIFGEHMTVPASDRLSQLYTGNGVNTRFDFTFRVFDQEDATGIAVKIDLGTEFETMDESLYQVTINQDNLGGYVVFNTAPSNQTSFYIAGETPVDQALDITNYDNFYPDSIEKSLDKLTAILQEWSHLLGFEEQARKLSNIKYDESAQLRENQIKAELQSNIDFIEQNTSAKLQEAIANGTVSALAITTVESESDLANLLTWDGRTVSVTSIGNYKYKSSTQTWERDFITDRQIVTVSSIAELQALNGVWEGRIVRTKGFYTADNFALAQPYVGGADYIYLEKNSNTNDGHGIFNGWTLIPMLELNVLQVGAKANFDYSTKTGTDDTQALKYAIKFAQSGEFTKGVNAPSGTYLFSDELNLTGLDWTNSALIASREWGQNTAGCYFRGDVNLATRLVFNPATKESVGISIRGGSGASSLRHIKNISILPFAGDREDNNTNERNGIALLLQDCCFSHVDDVFIGAFNVGVRLNNYQTDGFTEFNRFSNIRIDLCDIDVDYLISSENNSTVTDSFHGNSWESTQLQVRQGGGIAVRVKRESSSGVPVNCYHNKFDLNIFGGPGCIAFDLERGIVRAAYGDIRAEGPLNFVSHGTDAWFESAGSYQSISETNWIAPSDFSASSRIDTNFAFRFNNVMKPDQFFSGNNADLANSDALKPISITPQFSDRPFVGQHQDSGLMFVNRFDDVWGWGFGKFSEFYGNPRNVKLTYRLDQNGDFKYYGESFTIKNDTYGLQFSRNFSSFMPQQSGKISLGISQLYYKDVYSQNAVTVVSDARYKTEISELTEQELQCAIACGKLYRKYKLNAAVDEKGLNAARYHIGVIAQEVVQCFTDHNLDWHKYGIITYEKWDAIEAVDYQKATYDENGQELIPEIQAIAGREAGEIYMVRYDELNSFINAGLEYRLSQIEAKLID